MKPHPNNVTTKVSDNWKTAGWSQRPSDRRWTGHIVLPLKEKTAPTRKISGKQPKTVHKPTDFEFTKADLKPGTKINPTTITTDRTTGQEEDCET